MSTENVEQANTANEATATTATTEPVSTKDVRLSEKAVKWCRRVARISANRAFRTKSWAGVASTFDASKIEFYVLPKALARKRVSHTDSTAKIYLSADFFDGKLNLQKKMPRALKDELKAAIFKEVAHFAVRRPNSDFYAIMTRCPWTGPRVDGAPGSTQEARAVLANKRAQRVARRTTTEEIQTGLKEDVQMWDLLGRKHVLVKGADISLTKVGSIKIARGEFEGRKLRTMLKGGSELKKKLGL